MFLLQFQYFPACHWQQAMQKLEFEKAFSHKKAPSFVHYSSNGSLSKFPVMPNSSNTPSAGPNDPEHVWYYNADDDVPMGQPGSSKPTRTANNSI